MGLARKIAAWVERVVCGRIDATFDDLCWQGFSDPEYRTLELATHDFLEAVCILIERGYAVTNVVLHARLIYVVPHDEQMSAASRQFLAAAIRSDQMRGRKNGTI